MSRSTSPPLRVARRAAVAITLGLTLAGAASTPASAGVITKVFGRGYPTYSTCYDAGRTQAARQGADSWQCYRESGKYTGYLYFYT
jgi:hypothetical protein